VPELIEVEFYRRLAERTLGRTVAAVQADDEWFLKGGTTAASLDAALVGRGAVAFRRRGKLLLVDFDGGRAGAGEGPPEDGPTLGLRFGMTGRLVVDGTNAIERLEYSSGRDEPAWDRFALRYTDGSILRLQDPRRLGGVQLDPDEDRLGVDAVTVGPAELRRILAASTVALKARLLDQARLAGVGNLIADETMWRAGLDPARPARSLSPAEARRLHKHLHSTIEDLIERGGSHTGDLQSSRRRDGTCPRDGAPLDRRTVGGRTTYSCPVHQR
jgi:formamidopyrimidine-DNA glycosylase